MCATCGCGDEPPVEGEPALFLRAPSGHGHTHPHEHAPASPRTIAIERSVLARNDAAAAQNRAAFERSSIAAFNLTSAPGSGKTTLLEVLIERLRGRVPLAVIEGDQETERDAERIRAKGARAVQINTRAGCHLDAEMVAKAAAALEPPRSSLLLIENVGNLVCPALFDLGERAKIVLLSVTEGEDKPLKYPHMFRAAGVVVLTKIDLLPHLELDLGALLSNLRRINPALRVFQVSARDGAGLTELADWLAAEASGGAAP